jgi:hypothetical protein
MPPWRRQREPRKETLPALTAVSGPPASRSSTGRVPLVVASELPAALP